VRAPGTKNVSRIFDRADMGRSVLRPYMKALERRFE